MKINMEYSIQILGRIYANTANKRNKHTLLIRSIYFPAACYYLLSREQYELNTTISKQIRHNLMHTTYAQRYVINAKYNFANISEPCKMHES